MKAERILSRHQRFKEITRLRRGNALTRLHAGIMARLSGWRLYLLYRFTHVAKPEPLTGEGDMVVSLTTFPARIRNVWMVIDLLMRQSLRPAEIVLCLYEGDFPDRRLPESLDAYFDRGLKVIWAGTNLKPHLKYYSAFQREMQGTGRCVVTVDDDLFYAPDTLSRLAEMHARYPEAVCANIAKRISGDDYGAWETLRFPEGPSSDKLALGYGAVLYPRTFYASAPQLYDHDLITNLCLKADDLWLKYIEDRQGTEVATGEFFAVPPEIPSSQKFSLSSGNVSGGGNNMVWKALRELDGEQKTQVSDHKSKLSLQGKQYLCARNHNV